MTTTATLYDLQVIHPEPGGTTEWSTSQRLCDRDPATLDAGIRMELRRWQRSTDKALQWNVVFLDYPTPGAQVAGELHEVAPSGTLTGRVRKFVATPLDESPLEGLTWKW